MNKRGKSYCFIDTGLKPFPTNKNVASYVRKSFTDEIEAMYRLGYNSFFVRIDTLAGANFAMEVINAKKDKEIQLMGVSAYPDLVKIYSPTIQKLIKAVTNKCDVHFTFSPHYTDTIFIDTNDYILGQCDNVNDYSQMEFVYTPENGENPIIF